MKKNNLADGSSDWTHPDGGSTRSAIPIPPRPTSDALPKAHPAKADPSSADGSVEDPKPRHRSTRSADSLPPKPNGDALPEVHAAEVDLSLPAGAKRRSKTMSSTPPLADPLLALVAEQLETLERERIRLRNRVQICLQPVDKPDKDGHCRGLGISADEPVMRHIESVATTIEALERGLALELKRAFRKHPLFAWAQTVVGFKEGKVLARLLGVIGDPYLRPLSVNSKTEELRPGGPRQVSELWAYCGMHGDNAKRKKGEKANWSGLAKTRAFLAIEACIRQDGEPDKNGKPRPLSHYRTVYDTARRQCESKLHGSECKRCGPGGSPAQIGTPWSDGHKHGHAIRIAMKTLLRDLWLEAKRIHEEHTKETR